MTKLAEPLFIEKASRVKDLALAIVLIFAGIGCILLISDVAGTGIVKGQAVDHATLPQIWAIALIALTGLWMVRTIYDLVQVNLDIRKKGLIGAPPALPRLFFDLPKVLALRLAAAVVCLFVYATFLETVPFIVGTSVFLFAMLVTFGRPFERLTFVLSIGGGVFFHVLFVIFLKLPLQ